MDTTELQKAVGALEKLTVDLQLLREALNVLASDTIRVRSDIVVQIKKIKKGEQDG